MPRFFVCRLEGYGAQISQKHLVGFRTAGTGFREFHYRRNSVVLSVTDVVSLLVQSEKVS